MLDRITHQRIAELIADGKQRRAYSIDGDDLGVATAEHYEQARRGAPVYITPGIGDHLPHLDPDGTAAVVVGHGINRHTTRVTALLATLRDDESQVSETSHLLPEVCMARHHSLDALDRVHTVVAHQWASRRNLLHIHQEMQQTASLAIRRRPDLGTLADDLTRAMGLTPPVRDYFVNLRVPITLVISARQTATSPAEARHRFTRRRITEAISHGLNNLGTPSTCVHDWEIHDPEILEVGLD